MGAGAAAAARRRAFCQRRERCGSLSLYYLSSSLYYLFVSLLGVDGVPSVSAGNAGKGADDT